MLTFKPLSQAVLTTTATVYYQTPAQVRTTIKKLTLTNTSAAAATVTIYIVPAKGLAGAANTLTYQRNVAIGATLDIPEAVNHILGPGMSLQMLASAATAITAIASGVEMTT